MTPNSGHPQAGAFDAPGPPGIPGDFGIPGDADAEREAQIQAFLPFVAAAAQANPELAKKADAGDDVAREALKLHIQQQRKRSGRQDRGFKIGEQRQ